MKLTVTVMVPNALGEMLPELPGGLTWIPGDTTLVAYSADQKKELHSVVEGLLGRGYSAFVKAPGENKLSGPERNVATILASEEALLAPRFVGG